MEPRANRESLRDRRFGRREKLFPLSVQDTAPLRRKAPRWRAAAASREASEGGSRTTRLGRVGDEDDESEDPKPRDLPPARPHTKVERSGEARATPSSFSARTWNEKRPGRRSLHSATRELSRLDPVNHEARVGTTADFVGAADRGRELVREVVLQAHVQLHRGDAGVGAEHILQMRAEREQNSILALGSLLDPHTQSEPAWDPRSA